MFVTKEYRNISIDLCINYSTFNQLSHIICGKYIIISPVYLKKKIFTYISNYDEFQNSFWDEIFCLT